jgi:hypothetical protein
MRPHRRKIGPPGNRTRSSPLPQGCAAATPADLEDGA